MSVAPLFGTRLSSLQPSLQPNSLGIEDLTRKNVKFNWEQVILSNYMIDLEWLLSEAPDIQAAESIVVLVGDVHSSFTSAIDKRQLKKRLRIVCPPLPLPYGTHHSKLCILTNRIGVRVVVCTANFICSDWERKNQGIFVQDFPRYTEEKKCEVRTNSDFCEDLVEYFSRCGLNARYLRQFCFDSAAAHLVTSVPGYHQRGTHLFGLMKLQNLLTLSGLDDSNFPSLTLQYSSQGVLNDKFLSDVSSCMSTKKSAKNLIFVIPTEDEVRTSVEGWKAGFSIPIHLKSMHPFVNARLYRWSTRDVSCKSISRAMPHIKSYCRHDGKSALWFCLTSANLSRAAWGEHQKNDTQLQIRSYEVGVLFTAETLRKWKSFSCTSLDFVRPACTDSESGLHRVTLGENELLLPYNPLNPMPYASNDHLMNRSGGAPSREHVPWVLDVPHIGLDSLNQTFLQASENFVHYGPQAWKAASLTFRQDVIDVDAYDVDAQKPYKRSRTEAPTSQH